MFLHHLGATVGIADVDALAALPMPVLLDWMDYLRMITPDEGQRYTPPESAAGLLKKMYGG